MIVNMYRPGIAREEPTEVHISEPHRTGRFELGELKTLSELRLQREHTAREPNQPAAAADRELAYPDRDPLLDIDIDPYVSQQLPDSGSDEGVHMHKLGAIAAPAPVQKPVQDHRALPIDPVSAVLSLQDFPDFREQDDLEPEPFGPAQKPQQAVPGIARSKRTSAINRKYWGKQQQVERERQAELRVHGESGYRPNVEVLTKALSIRLDDSGSIGIDKTLALAGVPASKTGSVKTHAYSTMRTALVNVSENPVMQKIQADPTARRLIRSSESVGTILSNIPIAAELANLRYGINELQAWKADAEPRLQAVEAACARLPSPKALALEMLKAGRALKDIAEAINKSVPTVVRWKRDFKASGELT